MREGVSFPVEFACGRPLGLSVAPQRRDARGCCVGLVVTGSSSERLPGGIAAGDVLQSVNRIPLVDFGSNVALAVIEAATVLKIVFRRGYDAEEAGRITVKNREDDDDDEGAQTSSSQEGGIIEEEERAGETVVRLADGKVGLKLLPRSEEEELACDGLLVAERTAAAHKDLGEGDVIVSVNRVPLASFDFSVALDIFKRARRRECVVKVSRGSNAFSSPVKRPPLEAPTSAQMSSPSAGVLAAAAASASCSSSESYTSSTSQRSSSQRSSSTSRRPPREKASTRKTRASPRQPSRSGSSRATTDSDRKLVFRDNNASFESVPAPSRHHHQKRKSPKRHSPEEAEDLKVPPPPVPCFLPLSPPPAVDRGWDAPPPALYKGINIRGGHHSRGRVHGWHLVSKQIMESINSQEVQRQRHDDAAPRLHRQKFSYLFDNAMPPPPPR